MVVLMFFVFHVLIIGVPIAKINVHFAEPNLLKFFKKMNMEIIGPKILIFWETMKVLPFYVAIVILLLEKMMSTNFVTAVIM